MPMMKQKMKFKKVVGLIFLILILLQQYFWNFNQLNYFIKWVIYKKKMLLIY